MKGTIVKKILFSILFSMLLIISSGLATAFAADPPQYNIDFPVQIRAGVSIKMGAVVLLNPTRSTGLTVLVTNGTGQTANTFVPFAQRLLTDAKLGKKIARFVLLNSPGHGNSGFPVGIKYGDFSFADYNTAIEESIRKLGTIGLAPDFWIGHSIGAEFIHFIQDKLLKQGSSLRKEFGIKGAVFIAPDIIGPSPWAFTDSGAAVAVAGQLGTMNDQLGNFINFPPPVWIGLFFGDLKGQLPVGTPTPAQAVAADFISVDSAKYATDFLGIGGPRPQVAANIFAPSNGTIASLISLEQDGLYTQTEHKQLYTYLTGDNAGSLFFVVKGPDTVHNQHLINPVALIDIIRTTISKAGKSK